MAQGELTANVDKAALLLHNSVVPMNCSALTKITRSVSDTPSLGLLHSVGNSYRSKHTLDGSTRLLSEGMMESDWDHIASIFGRTCVMMAFPLAFVSVSAS